MNRQTSNFDPFSPEFLRDPYPYYEVLRDKGRIVWLERYGVWTVTHHSDAVEILSDWGTFCNGGGVGLTNYFKTKPWRPPSLILEADPPLHTRTRAVLTRILSPIAIRKLTADFEADAARIVDAAVERRSFDAIGDLAIAFPLKALPDSLGMPDEDRGRLITYGKMVAAGFGPPGAELDEIMSHADDVLPWIAARCRREALSPDGLGAQIYAAADAGELTEDEAGLLVRSFLSAGVDTTFNAISQTFNALVDHPAQWAILRDDPTLARAAFEEALRYDASGQVIVRTTTRAAEFAGVAFDQYDKVFVYVGSANRDPARWENADVYDIRRKTAGHLTFGTGIHGCVAQMVARMEGEALFGALARRVETIEESAPRVRRVSPGARGLDSLPVTVVPKAH